MRRVLHTFGPSAERLQSAPSGKKRAARCPRIAKLLPYQRRFPIALLGAPRESGALRSYLRGLVILSSCRLSMLFRAAVIGCTWTRTHSQLNSSAVAGGAWNEPLQGWSRRKCLRHLLTPLVQWVEDDIAPERDSLRVPGALIRRKQSTRAATPTTQLTLSASNPESNERDWIVSSLLQDESMELLRLKQRNLRTQLHVDQHLCSALNLLVQSRLLRW
jgi:hypothetical protein